MARIFGSLDWLASSTQEPIRQAPAAGSSKHELLADHVSDHCINDYTKQ